jgi:excisionase family DNA binding protein
MKKPIIDPITTAEAADILGLKYWAVSEWCRVGKLDCARVGSRYLVSKSEVEALIESIQQRLTLAEAADMLGVSPQWVHQMRADGKIKATKIRGRWRVLRSDVEAMIEARGR